MDIDLLPASFELWEHRGQPFSPVTVSPFTPHNLTLFNPQLVLVLVPLSLYVYHDTHQQNMFQFWRQVSHNPGLATRRVALMFTKFDELKRLLPHYEISRWWPKCTGALSHSLLGRFKSNPLNLTETRHLARFCIPSLPLARTANC